MSPATGADPRWVVFDYEVMMFRNMCGLLVSGNQEYELLSSCVKNAIAESALLHTRQLADILLSRGSQPDDINLRALLPDSQPQGLNPLRQHYGDNRNANTPCWTINKRMAHPTTQRGDSFDYSLLLNGLVPLIAAVLEEVQVQRSKSAG